MTALARLCGLPFLLGKYQKCTSPLETSTDYFYGTDFYAQIVSPCNKDEVRNFTKAFLPVAYSLICVVGLVGNIFVVMTFALYKKSDSMTDVCLCNMAIVDILFVLTLPFWAVTYALDEWIFGNFICKLVKGIYAINFNCGMLLLACISMDRYLAIVQATKSFRFRSKTVTHSKVICVAVWASSILISTSTFMFSESYTFSVNETKHICEHKFSQEATVVWKLVIVILQLFFGFFLPVLFMLFCYAFIIKTLVQAQNSKRSKAIRAIVSIVVVFFLCQVPYNMVLLVTAATMGRRDKDCKDEMQIDYAKYTTEALAFFHCCMNPVLYAFIGVKFRNYFFKIMANLFCGRYWFPIMCPFNSIRTMMEMGRRRLRRTWTLDEIRKDASFLYPPPDGGWGWVVVLAASIISLFVSGFHSAFGVYMLPLLQAFESTNSKIAWIGSVSYAFIMIFGPVSGKLLVKHGAIKVAIIGALVVMFGMVCSSYTYDLRVLFLTQGIIVGIGSSLASTPGLIMVSLYFTTKRSFATGIVMAGGAAGTFVQNKLHQYLIDKLGWRVSLRVYSGILTICIFAGFAYKPLQKHRAHPSVVEKFKTSPLRGFIVDLSLWKDRIFEVWVSALGLAKFGFFIPFVHMIKLAGDLGIPPDDASYIMVGIGVSSMISCLIFGKLCDIEKIDRLYLNQASILSVGVVYFIIPYCTTFASLVAICSLLGFVDSGNYVLLPVLTFDLMGEEKMPVAWGFMMAVNAISCFGPPFAGAMYDIYGSYTIGFVVTGVGNIAAASILAFIPWLKNEARQSKKNYLNASVCEITKTIVPWQSPTPSLGSLTSSYTKSVQVSPEGSTSELSKINMKAIKSILKSDTTSCRGSISERGAPTPQRRTERAGSIGAAQTDRRASEQIESKTSLRGQPTPEVAGPDVAFLPHDSSEHIPERKEEGVTITLYDYAAYQEQRRTSITELRPVEERVAPQEEVPEAAPSEPIKQVEQLPYRKEVVFIDDYKVEDEEEEEEETERPTDLAAVEELPTPEAIRQVERPPHRKEYGVTFLDEYEGEEEEGASDLRPRKAPLKSEAPVPSVQTGRVPHRKEDGVAFVDEYDSDDDIFESATDLMPMEGPFKSEAPARAKTKKQMPSILHRKEDGVAFLDDFDIIEDEHLKTASGMRPMLQPSWKSEASRQGKSTGQMRSTHRKEDGVAFLDDYDSDDDDGIFESATDLMPMQEWFKSDTPAHAKRKKPMPPIPHRKEDGVAFLDDYDSDDGSFESATDLTPMQELFKSDTLAHAKHKKPMPPVLHRKEDGLAFLEDIGNSQQEQLDSAAALGPAEDVDTEREALVENEASASIKGAEHVPCQKEDPVTFDAAQDDNEQSEEKQSE
ncbi:hypothetical protein JRQ81_009641 [Phrynocephalus forsythii]|uniref:Uncharacterized protein n=1 Tax=Phrynocephalus forsythii TaxID=171643 RepID=A0A9Q0Y5P1_9SAUR|nr:hypothetical protein JRQ81_009641 [Phrynocephalus forsythii]